MAPNGDNKILKQGSCFQISSLDMLQSKGIMFNNIIFTGVFPSKLMTIYIVAKKIIQSNVFLNFIFKFHLHIRSIDLHSICAALWELLQTDSPRECIIQHIVRIPAYQPDKCNSYRRHYLTAQCIHEVSSKTNLIFAIFPCRKKK